MTFVWLVVGDESMRAGRDTVNLGNISDYPPCKGSTHRVGAVPHSIAKTARAIRDMES